MSVRRMYHISQTGHVFENEVLCWYSLCVCVMCIHWQLLVYRYCTVTFGCCRAVAAVFDSVAVVALFLFESATATAGSYVRVVPGAFTHSP